MTARTLAQERPPRMATWKALLLTLAMLPFAATGLLSGLLGDQVDPLWLIAGLIAWVVLTVFFFGILVTGKIHRYRSVLFISLGIAVPAYLIPQLFEAFGTNMLTEEMTLAGKAQFCPLALFMVILPALFKRVVIFPGAIAYGGMWFVLWMGASLTVGRGWCSWGCILGGWDELFSGCARRP